MIKSIDCGVQHVLTLLTVVNDVSILLYHEHGEITIAAV